MNQALIDLLTDKQRVDQLVGGLPEAFEIVAANFPSDNPAVGVPREQALVGFLRASLGSRRVKVATSGTQRGYDLKIDSHPLSLKTVTGAGRIKMVWTADQTSVKQELSTYRPSEDMLLIRIFWGKKKRSIFYIPVEVQREVYARHGQEYLKVNTDTNHRGIEVGKQAMSDMESHPSTIALDVDWQKRGLKFRAYKRWEAFWNRKSRQ